MKKVFLSLLSNKVKEVAVNKEKINKIHFLQINNLHLKLINFNKIIIVLIKI
jgi:hypothetical protein